MQSIMVIQPSCPLATGNASVRRFSLSLSVRLMAVSTSSRLVCCRPLAGLARLALLQHCQHTGRTTAGTDNAAWRADGERANEVPVAKAVRCGVVRCGVCRVVCVVCGVVCAVWHGVCGPLLCC